MPEILNAGYSLQYLWDKHQQLCELAGFDLGRIQRTLASFQLATYQSPSLLPVGEQSDIERHILAVYTNLLQRGLPTLAPLRVERALAASVQDIIPLKETNAGGSYRFESGTMNRQLKQDWLETLVDAHLAIDPRLHPIDHRTDHFDALAESVTFGSNAEHCFYTRLLPRTIGPAATLHVELQRPLESLLPEGKQGNFHSQRVDFALELGSLRIVYEVDGPQHENPKQKNLDKRRDQALLSAGWRTERIATSQVETIQTQAHLRDRLPTEDAALTRLNQVYADPLWNTPQGSAALHLALGPYAVARIQRALLWALDTGRLHLNQPRWRLVVVERDVRVATLAVVDFLEHLTAFYQMWQLDRMLPKVELWLYSTEEFAAYPPLLSTDELAAYSIQVTEQRLNDPASDYVNGDLLIDTAILQPEGFQRLDASFINRHLTTMGIVIELRSCLSPYDMRRLSVCTPLPYPIHAGTEPALLFFLRNIFRKKDFRDGQFQILARSLALKPVIGLLPTGAGKSLCYQLSALLQAGLTLMVAPLTSLIMDQVDNMRERLALDWVEYITGQRTTDERNQIQRRMAQGKLLLILMAPERLQSHEFRDYLESLTRTVPVIYAVIDEAHCVSEWGHDFRTAYLKLAATIRARCQFRDYTPAILALTGTASFAVLSDVQREIGVEDESAKIYPKTFDRPELCFGIVKVPSSQKASALRRIMQQTLTNHGWAATIETDSALLAEKGGWITFVPHTNSKYGVLDVRAAIQQIDQRLGVEIFSGKQPKNFMDEDFDTHKAKVQRDFKQNSFPVLVATKAFGMGVDKANIRYTVHYNIPQSLESYYQEAGRAGRDRQPAQCWIIFSDDYPDEADRALHPDAALSTVKMIADNGRDRGDVQRLLFLQQQSFPGIESELATIRTLLRTHLLPPLMGIGVGEQVDIAVPFGNKEESVEKAVYRLSILGFVQDYTVDYRAKRFNVRLEKVPEEIYIKSLQAYIRRYKTRDISDTVAADIEQEPAETVLGKCVLYLLRFVYIEVERKRRVAIQSMLEVARRAVAAGDPETASEVLRRELLAYLEKSAFTESLEQIAQQIEPQEWVTLLGIPDEIGLPLLRSVDGVRQLIGGCRRTLESYPDHPGLLFLSSLARLLLAAPEVEIALDEAKQAFTSLQKVTGVDRFKTTALLLDAYQHWLKETRDHAAILSKIAASALAADPSRQIARLVYPHAPQQSRSVLLNLTFDHIHRLAERLCG